MATHLKVIDTSPADPVRTKLGEAIEREKTAEIAGLRARSAVGRAEAMVAEAETALEAAKAEAEKARDAFADSLAAAATSGAAAQKTDTAARDARIREADAQDELDAARAALVHVTAQADELWDAFRAATKDVIEAVNELLIAELPRLLAEAQRMHDDLIGRAKLLSDLVSFNFFAVPEAIRNETRYFVMRVQNLQASAGDVYHRAPEACRWARAREQLRADANTPLPDKEEK